MHFHKGKIMNKVMLGIAAMVALSGCATIMNGDLVSVPVTTVPTGATVTINGATYTSPATVTAPRGKGDFNLHIEKEGYRSVDILLTPPKDGWLWGNIVFGGIIGLAVDFLSGDAYDLDPEMVEANLEGADVTKAEDGTLQFVLVDLNELPEALAKRVKSRSSKAI